MMTTDDDDNDDGGGGDDDDYDDDDDGGGGGGDDDDGGVDDDKDYGYNYDDDDDGDYDDDDDGDVDDDEGDGYDDDDDEGDSVNDGDDNENDVYDDDYGDSDEDDGDDDDWWRWLRFLHAASRLQSVMFHPTIHTTTISPSTTSEEPEQCRPASPYLSSTKATPPDMPAAKLRPVEPSTTTRPPVMYSQPWSPTPCNRRGQEALVYRTYSIQRPLE